MSVLKRVWLVWMSSFLLLCLLAKTTTCEAVADTEDYDGKQAEDPDVEQNGKPEGKVIETTSTSPPFINSTSDNFTSINSTSTNSFSTNSSSTNSSFTNSSSISLPSNISTLSAPNKSLNAQVGAHLHVRLTLPQPNEDESRVKCYTCNSQQSKYCNRTHPCGPPRCSCNCSSPNQVANNWLTSIGLSKLVGSFDLEKSLLAGGKVNDSDLVDIRGCTYFYASNETEFTKGVESGVAYVRSLFGEHEGATEAAPLKEYTLRSCTNLRIRKEAKDLVDRCITIPGTANITNVLMCICTSNKCNHGSHSPVLRLLISDVKDAKDGATEIKAGAGATLKLWSILMLNYFVMK